MVYRSAGLGGEVCGIKAFVTNKKWRGITQNLLRRMT